MEYTNEERQRIVLFSINRADEALEAATLLSSTNSWLGCSNLLYHAAHRIINALLIKSNHFTKNYGDNKRLLNEYFINVNILQKEHGDFYTQLFDNKQKGDFEVFKYFKKEEIFPMIQTTKEFIETLKSFTVPYFF